MLVTTGLVDRQLPLSKTGNKFNNTCLNSLSQLTALQYRNSCLHCCNAHACLAKVDRTINSCVEGTEVVKIFRYVNGFLVVFRDNHANSVEKVESVFHEYGDSLNFVKKVPAQDAFGPKSEIWRKGSLLVV